MALNKMGKDERGVGAMKKGAGARKISRHFSCCPKKIYFVILFCYFVAILLKEKSYQHLGSNVLTMGNAKHPWQDAAASGWHCRTGSSCARWPCSGSLGLAAGVAR